MLVQGETFFNNKNLGILTNFFITDSKLPLRKVTLAFKYIYITISCPRRAFGTPSAARPPDGLPWRAASRGGQKFVLNIILMNCILI